MSSPYLADHPRPMTVRGFIFLGIACMLGAVAVSTMVEAEAQVISLENGLGAEVQISRL